MIKILWRVGSSELERISGFFQRAENIVKHTVSNIAECICKLYSLMLVFNQPNRFEITIIIIEL